MPSQVFKQIYVLAVGVILGITLLNLLGTPTELIAGWCFLLTVYRSAR